MAAKIGMLGESTTTTVATTTVYTVGTDKAARVRILFQSEGPANTHTFSLLVGTPSNQVKFHKSMATNVDLISGARYLDSGHDGDNGLVDTQFPSTLSLSAAALGAQEVASMLYLGDADNSAFDMWAAPLSADYYLNEGDTVRYGITGTAPNNLLFQIHGVEDDA